jgi:hypothetical protein
MSIVPGGPVHQNKGISKTTNGKTVTKSDIHMNRIKIEATGAVKLLTTFCLKDGSKGTKKQGKFAAVDPYTIPTDL